MLVQSVRSEMETAKEYWRTLHTEELRSVYSDTLHTGQRTAPPWGGFSTGWTTGNCGSFPLRNKRFVSIPKRPECFWGHPASCSEGTGGYSPVVKRPGFKLKSSPPLWVYFKSESWFSWHYNSVLCTSMSSNAHHNYINVTVHFVEIFHFNEMMYC